MSKVAEQARARLAPAYKTRFGKMFCGSAEHLLVSRSFKAKKGQVQLVFTSPPFPLRTKKKYGNYEGSKYVKWLASFAQPLVDLLADDGSIVLELGNAWEKGRPIMSTLPLEALLAFKEAGRLYLCQEFICFNPARLPGPAQWVTVERCRVKDAFTRLWWLSPTERPKANNRNVLTEYSDSMRKLFERGTYNPGVRPSQHHVHESAFLTDHGGAIPPNVLVPAIGDMLAELLSVLPIANTRSVDSYRRYCKENGFESHPARMPTKLVEFFLKFLTDEKDLVIDPFGGSNTTGYVCETLKRKWMSIDANEEYVKGSYGWFSK